MLLSPQPVGVGLPGSLAEAGLNAARVRAAGRPAGVCCRPVVRSVGEKVMMRNPCSLRGARLQRQCAGNWSDSGRMLVKYWSRNAKKQLRVDGGRPWLEIPELGTDKTIRWGYTP